VDVENEVQNGQTKKYFNIHCADEVGEDRERICIS